MDLLSGYGSSDEDDGGDLEVPTGKTESAVEKKGRNYSDDSEEDTMAPQKLAARPLKAKSLLPSVDDLFASSGPSFLAAPKVDFTVAPITKKRKPEGAAETASSVVRAQPTPSVVQATPKDSKDPKTVSRMLQQSKKTKFYANLPFVFAHVTCVIKCLAGQER
jgi:hypothetical protein